ncbi:hypothetical protein D6C98_04508 [Aureobasidium pullulans]|nr:hypothetical protein D6C98_04508 [Aureobasidium pullulans]
MNPEETGPRARIKIACDDCRRGKRKCDGRKPRCTLCTKSDRVCHYASEDSRKRVFQDEDLVLSLREEIKALRDALKSTQSGNVGRQMDDPEINHDTRNSSFVIAGLSSSISEGCSTPLGEDQAFESRSSHAMNELSSLMLQLDVADIGEPSFTLSASKVPQTKISNSPDIKFDVEVHNEDCVTFDDRHYLIECFSKTFNRFHQFLETDELVNMALSEPAVGDIDLTFRNNALYAVAASCSDITRIQNLEKSFKSRAEGLVFRCIKETPTDLVVQGLALLAWTELQSGCGSMAYNWIAMATGQVLHLGLHASALKSARLSGLPDQRVQKRRVRSFWAYFSVDRLVTSSLGMNCTMHWQRVKSTSFTSIVLTGPTVDEWAHERFCEMWHLWDSCMDQGYAFGWYRLSQTEKEKLVLHSHQTLTKFYETTNAYLHTPEDRLSETAVWLQLSYQAALILIHRPLLSEASGSKAGRFSLTVATTAAAAISRTVREFGATRNFTAIAPQIIDYISIAATMHLLNATSGKNRLGRQSANGLRTCVQTLSEMSPAWEKRAQDSLQHIQNLAHRWEVVWALPIQHSQVLACGARPLNTEQDFGGLGPESHAAVDVYNVFDDTALNTAAETLWGTEGTADHDWILQAAEGIPLSKEGLWDFDWQHLGGA